jgi:hypothetical protein
MRLQLTRQEMHTELWWQSVLEKDHLEYQQVDGRIILRRILEIYEGVSKSFRTESITKYTLTFGIRILNVSNHISGLEQR